MLARLQPRRHQDRLGSRGRGHHDIGAGHGALRVGLCGYRQPQIAGKLSGDGIGPGRVTGPNDRRLNRADQGQGLELQPRLNPGAENGGIPGIIAGQVAGRHCAGGGGAHIGQIPIVEKHRLNQPGAGAEQNHQSVDAGKTQFRVVEKTRADLDGEAVDAGHIGGFNIDLAVKLLDIEPQDRWHDHRLGGQGGKSILDAVDGARVKGNCGAQLVFGNDGDLFHFQGLDRYALAGGDPVMQ